MRQAAPAAWAVIYSRVYELRGTSLLSQDVTWPFVTDEFYVREVEYYTITGQVVDILVKWLVRLIVVGQVTGYSARDM